MISIDSHESFSPWIERSEVTDSEFDNINLDFDPLNYLLSSSGSRQYADDFPIDLPLDLNGLDIEDDAPYDFARFDFSPVKTCTLEDLNREAFLKLSSEKFPGVEPFDEKQYAPLSPDSGIGQDQPSASFEDCDDLFSLLEQEKDIISLCDPVKVNNESEVNKILQSFLTPGKSGVDADSKSSASPSNLPDSMGYCVDKLTRANIESFNQRLVNLNQGASLNGFQHSKNDSSEGDHWIDADALNSDPIEIDFSVLCADPLLVHSSPVKENCKPNTNFDDNLFVLRNDSRTIQVEHSYCKKPCVVDSDEEDEPVKKRKRNDVDEDFSPYQKPKRKAGRPRTNFSKPDTHKTQRLKPQKTKTSKRTSSQASKKIKSCSSVPFDRREQHNQAERERRDMLKKNLDIVEDITPDHVLQLTQIALQSEKTGKPDELENNENNFTVDVLKKLDELMKKEPVSHRPKYKKASRNSKMVVLLGSTYYIGSLEKELKVKESRLAQLKKQYEDCLKRFNPKGSSKKIRRNY